jgi:primary-amine oxidase
MDTVTLLPEEYHPQISPEELIACEDVVKNNPVVQKLAKDVGEHHQYVFYLLQYRTPPLSGIEPEQIFCDGWSIGYDERFPQKRRVQQGLVYARFSPHDNLYAHPMVCL